MSINAHTRLLPLVALFASLIGGACSERGISDTVDLTVDYNQMPTMTTTDVVTMISDSGYTRYRITSDLWLVYEQAQVPVWRFPTGLLLEKFDTTYTLDATVICDSATYFKNEQKWRLDGHVNIVNSIGEKFLTPQLFWSQRDNKIYSDSFIHIERADRTIEGYGFESNDRLTRYTVYNPTGIFPASDFKPGAKKSETLSDSISPEPDATKPKQATKPERKALKTNNTPPALARPAEL